VDTVLGLFVILLWIVAVVVLAAAVTFVVVKVFPAERAQKTGTSEPPYSGS
jgi:hypothetical protein